MPKDKICPTIWEDLVKVAFAVGILYLFYVYWYRSYAIQSTIEAGTCPPILLSPVRSIQRKRLIDQLVAILLPDTPRDTFVLITGEHGTGKTASILMACHRVRKGVIYTTVPANTQLFGQHVGKAIGFQFDELNLATAMFFSLFNSPTHGREPKASWNRMWPFLLQAAEQFNSTFGHPPILIIDNSNLLAQHEPEFFDTLMLTAKEYVQQIKFIFIFSGGNGPALVMEHSSWSRGDLFEVGDMSDEDAVTYLRNLGVLDAVAAPIVANLTGGRFTLLNKARPSYEETRAILRADCMTDFDATGLFAGNLTTEAWGAVERILAYPDGIPLQDLKALISEDSYLRLLDKRVISVHLQSRLVTMHSRTAEGYAREVLPQRKQ